MDRMGEGGNSDGGRDAGTLGSNCDWWLRLEAVPPSRSRSSRPLYCYTLSPYSHCHPVRKASFAICGPDNQSLILD